jgi:hypothetical protein
MRKIKIISLVPRPGSKVKAAGIDRLSRYAWNFTHTILWPEETFSDEDISRAVDSIRKYFELAADKRTAFICFCERIILAESLIAAKPDRYVPNPSVWFNHNYEQGFAATKCWHELLESKRAAIPGYGLHIYVLASHYLDYSLMPTSKVFYSCRKKLLGLNAGYLLQYFYNLIIHLTHPII